MASLRDLADRALQRSRQDGTVDGTPVEQAEQGDSLFQAPDAVPTGVEQALREKSAKNQPCSTVPLPKGGTGGTSDLAGEIRAGVRSLRRRPCPMGVNPKAWRQVTLDALSLARDGWAGKALALGWSPLDLYGAVTDPDGYADADGLAVWLEGRPVLAICATYASVGDGTGRAYFNRCNRLGETLLWEIGR